MSVCVLSRRGSLYKAFADRVAYSREETAQPRTRWKDAADYFEDRPLPKARGINECDKDWSDIYSAYRSTVDE